MGCDDGFFLKASDATDRQSIRENPVKINVIEAIESYSASHPETINEILYEWPWKKFEALYEAHIKREQSQRALSERNAWITGLLANTNLDDGKSTKKNMLDNIDNTYENTLKSIYNIEDDNEIDFKNDPFFKAIKSPGQETWRDTTDSEPTTDKPEIDIDQQ